MVTYWLNGRDDMDEFNDSMVCKFVPKKKRTGTLLTDSSSTLMSKSQSSTTDVNLMEDLIVWRHQCACLSVWSYACLSVCLSDHSSYSTDLLCMSLKCRSVPIRVSYLIFLLVVFFRILVYCHWHVCFFRNSTSVLSKCFDFLHFLFITR